MFNLREEGVEDKVNEFIATVDLVKEGALKITSDSILVVNYVEKTEGAKLSDLLLMLDEQLISAQTKRLNAEANLRLATINASLKRGGKEKRQEALDMVRRANADVESYDFQIGMIKGLVSDLKAGKLDDILAGYTGDLPAPDERTTPVWEKPLEPELEKEVEKTDGGDVGEKADAATTTGTA